MKTLKELRMWHWRKFLHYRAMQRANEKVHAKTAAGMARRDANLHLGAVQVLNDHVPGTADNDCATEDSLQDALKGLPR